MTTTKQITDNSFQMSILKEITDSIVIVSDAIKNIKEIHAAIKQGTKYFEKQHPEIKKDVIAMCSELQKTCNGIAIASSVITHFRFNSSPAAIDNEPTRFNDYFIKYKSDKNEAEILIRSLKGHCSIIKQHADTISQGNSKSFWSFFGLQSEAREKKLANLLQQIYDDERDFHSIVYHMAHSMNAAINDVTKTLEESNMMTSKKVPDAANKLSEYSKIFLELELLARNTRDNLEKTIQEIQ